MRAVQRWRGPLSRSPSLSHTHTHFYAAEAMAACSTAPRTWVDGPFETVARLPLMNFHRVQQVGIFTLVLLERSVLPLLPRVP